MNNQHIKRELFIWKLEHDRYLIGELLLLEPCAHKQQTRARGSVEICDRQFERY